MSLLGKIIGTAFDVVTTPIAVAKDMVPGCGGYIDGNRSKTGEKIEDLSDDLKEIRDDLEDL
jgi:hypothetical protein